ncbi:glycosyltransferase family 4 protein [Candidatus Dependentiae bacterium]
MPKIAILTLHPENYGGILSSLRVVYEFCSKYFEPTVFFVGFDHKISAHLRPLKFNSEVRRKNYFGMRCVEIGSRWAFWEPWHYAATLKIWEKELRDFEYFFVTSGTCIAAHPLTLLKKKFLLWPATPYDDDRLARRCEMSVSRRILENLSAPFMRKIELDILRSASLVLPMSFYAKKQFSVMAGLDPDDMDVCGFPVKTVMKGCKENQKIVVAIGRFDDPRKNIEMLLRVWRRVIRQQPEAKLIIIGNTPQKEKIRGFENLINSGCVRFTGWISEDEKQGILKSASVMLITSHQEGLGIIGLEAMANSVPVISTICGGTSDYVLDGKTGFLVDVDDDDSMAVLTNSVLESKPLRERLSHNSFELVKKRFSHKFVQSTFSKGLVSVWPELASVLL